MSTSPSGQILVVITSPPALESQLVDWLLAQDGGNGFSSATVHGHSTHHDHLSIAEQVSGKQRRLQFQVQMASDRMDGFLESLESEFGGADLHFWAVPVLAGGHLGRSELK